MNRIAVLASYRRAWAALRRRPLPLLAATVPIIVVRLAFLVAASRVSLAASQLGLLALGTVVEALATRPLVRACLAGPGGPLGAYLLASIVYGLAVTVALILLSLGPLGLFLCVAAFAVLGANLGLYPWLILEEGLGVRAAFRRSRSLQRADSRHAFALWAVFFTVNLLLLPFPLSYLAVTDVYRRLSRPWG